MTPFAESSPYYKISKGKRLTTEAGGKELCDIVNNKVPFGKSNQLMENGFASSPTY